MKFIAFSLHKIISLPVEEDKRSILIPVYIKSGRWTAGGESATKGLYLYARKHVTVELSFSCFAVLADECPQLCLRLLYPVGT
jgi:hypothetical protein